MRFKSTIMAATAMLIVSLSASATRSPFDTAPATLYEEATNFYEGRNYLASIRYYKDFLKYKPSEVTAEDERVRIANQNIALAAFMLRQSDAAMLLEKYKEEYPYTQNAEQIELYLGVLDFERGKYKKALKRFEKVKAENLSKDEFLELVFYRGYCYVRQNKFQEASYELLQVLKQPENRFTTPAHYYYGYSQFYQGNYKTSLSHLLTVKDEKKYKSTLPYLLCQCYYKLGDCERATAIGDSLLETKLDKKLIPSVHHTIASCKYENKEYAGALESLQKYQKAGKKLQREDLYMMGMCYFKTDNAQKAIECLSKVTKPDDVITQNSYFHIAMAYLSLGDKKNARLAFERASTYSHDKEISCDALYNYALVTYEMSYSPFNESVSAFERFLKEYPDSKNCAKVYEYLVNVYLTTKNYSDAYQSIQQIEKKSPAVLEAEERVLFGMGTTQIANRKYADAAESFKTLLSNKSYNKSLNTRAYFWYGECLFRQGKYDEAIKNFNTYLSKSSSRGEEEYAYAHYNLGYSYLKKGNKSESTNWFRKFIMIDGIDKQMKADAYNRIGDNYFLQRKFPEAKQAYTGAIGVADKVAGADYALYQTGIINGVQKNYNEKITTLQSLLDKYPKSQWADDALYEIGNSYVALSDNENAITTFRKVATSYPKNNAYVRQSRLQIALLLYNENKVDESIAEFRDVATQFSGTEESQTALESLENIMVDNNRVAEYAEMTKAMNKRKDVKITIKEDSLMYKAAEKVYFKDDFNGATNSFKSYIEKYPDGKYNSLAKYYLANCYYRSGNKDDALALYKQIVNDADNPNKEETLLRAATMSFDRQEWSEALTFYTELSQIGTPANKKRAKIGIMRSAYAKEAYNATITAANDVLSDAIDSEIISEAKYLRMKSNIALGNSALSDIKDLSADTRNVYGAEAEYQLLQHYYDTADYVECEKEFFSFVDKGTPHSYYLAKAFLVLADCYVAQQKYFDAKQYLYSLRDNYKPAPADITDAIQLRLNLIEMKETEVQPEPADSVQLFDIE